MWLPQNHWKVFCLQSLEHCLEALNGMLTAFATAIPRDCSGSLASASMSGCSAESQPELADLRQDVSGLIEGIWERFQQSDFCYGTFDSRHKIGGFDTFGDAAFAFDQPGIALQSFKLKLEVSLALMSMRTHPVPQMCFRLCPDIEKDLVGWTAPVIPVCLPTCFGPGCKLLHQCCERCRERC